MPEDELPEPPPPVDKGVINKEKKSTVHKSKFASIHDYKDAADDNEDESQW